MESIAELFEELARRLSDQIDLYSADPTLTGDVEVLQSARERALSAAAIVRDHLESSR